MRDLREDLESIWRMANRLPASIAGANVIMFVSALSGEGTTSMAASFASIAARRTEKPTWLVDLDLKRNRAFSGFEKRFARDIGKPGRAFDASLRRKPIYSLSPRAVDSDAKQDKLLTAHEIEGLPLLVTRFRRERLIQGQQPILQHSPEWWTALRKISGCIVVDAPALDRSAAALTMAEEADGIVLVVEADRTNAVDVAGALRDLESKRGHVLGAVMNRVGADAQFADRFTV